jgi:error-prone DNA polymerase
MPEIAFPKIRPRVEHESLARPLLAEAACYAELHCRTNYSFLQAASHPDELVQRAAELGHAALAITDRNSLAGVVRAHAAAKQLGLKLLIGAEVTLEEGPSAVLLATNRTGYGRLSRLLTLGKRRAKKGECHLTFADVAHHSEHLLACVLLPGDMEFVSGESRLVADLHRWRDTFGDRCYALAQLHRGPHDAWLLQRFQELVQQARLPLVASNGVLYHIAERRYLHDVLTATRLGVTVSELGAHRLANGERHLKSASEMQSLFAACPATVERTLEVAGRCQFSLDELKYEYPEELCPRGETPLAWLTQLTAAGARERYPLGLPDKVKQQIEHELALIEDLHYEAYFLTVWDLVRFARSRGILCQGRGSAANSAVCFCLGVTSVDPDRIDVLFERFISKERGEAPDIDVDFEHERREEVLQYLYEKYGRDRAAMTAEVITYRPKSAVRDVGKALGLSLDRVDILAKSVEHSRHEDDAIAARFRETGFDPTSRLGRQLIHLVKELLGFPRHLSQHVGGMVITRGRLDELTPLENAAMPGRTVLEWDKDDLDALGILKVDCLALGMLTAIRKALAFVNSFGAGDVSPLKTPSLPDRVSPVAGWGQAPQNSELADNGFIEEQPPRPPILNSAVPDPSLTLATIPAEDPAVYEMLCRAESIGVFQVESRAQMSMLPRLKPRCFYDLVVEVAIVRPGPIQGNMVHPYLRRRSGEEQVSFPSEAVREVLRKTLGVPIFQEQAMKLAVVAAGFTPGEADQLRRAMGAWRRRGVMETFRQKLLAGMRARGYEEDFANRVYEQIQGFGEYGFPESHAASFALLVYASAWLKHHHPAAFTAALLNSQPLGFYAPAQLVSEARRQGVEVRSIDANASDWDCTLEEMTSDEMRVTSNEWRDARDECGGVRDECGVAREGGSPPVPSPRLCGERVRVRGQSGENAFDLESPSSRSPVTNGWPTSTISPPHPNPLPPKAGGEGTRDVLAPCQLRCQPQHVRALRLGFRLISGLRRATVEQIVAARQSGPFVSQADFVRRTGIGRSDLSLLAKSGAFQSLKTSRRTALWDAMPAQESAPLFESVNDDEPAVTLPQMTSVQEVVADYQTAGLSLLAHPLSFLRDELNPCGVIRIAELAHVEPERRYRVAGLVLLRQRPSTAKGITFMTIEDETGTANLIVHVNTWERFRPVARGASALIVRGTLQRQHGVTHLLVDQMLDLTAKVGQVANRSRDFR